MKFDGEFKLKSTELMMKERGLEDGGLVQQFIDSECIKQMKPYTPKQSGVLENSAELSTVIGSGKIEQHTPYARYLYYGEVYGPNYPIRNGKISFNEEDGPIEGWVSAKKKSPTGRELKYNTAVNPKAGKMWFERMKADHKDEILAGAIKVAGGRT